MGIPVDLVGPDGREYTLPDDSRLQEALAAGFRQLGPEGRTWGEAIQGTLGEVREQVVTGAEAVLRGGTAGLSDVALAKLYEDPADKPRAEFNIAEMRRRREEHPIAAIGGELAGMVASPIAKIAPFSGATALGRIGAGIANQGIQGGLYGAGNALSEAALGNTEVTAEKLVAGAGLGALLGAAGGGIGHVLEKGVRVAAPAVGRAAAGFGGSLKRFADERWLKASGGIMSDIRKIAPAEHAAVADALRAHLKPLGSLDDAAKSLNVEREQVAEAVVDSVGLKGLGLKPAMDRDAALDVLKVGEDVAGKRMGVVLEGADNSGALAEYHKIHKRLDDFEVGLDLAEQDIVKGSLKSVREYLYKMSALPVGSKNAGFAALNHIKASLSKGINYKTDSPLKNRLEKQIVGILMDEIDTQLSPQIGATLAKEFLESKAAFGLLKRGEEALGRETATGADAIAALVEGAGLASPEAARLSALNHASRLLGRGQERELGRWVSASDYLAGIGGGIMHGGLGGALLGLPVAIGHKLLREKGSALIASLADHISASPALNLAAQSFAAKATAAVPHFGQYAPMLAQALAHSPAVGLATHLTWANGDPDYAEAAQRAGFLPETDEEHEAAGNRAQQLVGLGAALKSTDDRISAGIDKVFRGGASVRRPNTTGSQDFGAKRMRRESLAAHQRRMDEVADLAANPEALLERVTANMGRIGEASPGASAAATAVVHRAVTYLAAQIQRPPKPGPLAQEWRFSDAELFVFAKKLEAVQEPLSVLEYAAAATLTQDQMAAVQAVYPTVYAQMRDKVLERLAETPKGTPYASRMVLRLLSGVDVDGTIGQTAKNQAAIAAKSSKASEQMGGGGSTEGAGALKVAQSFATPQQHREMQREES